MCFTQKRHRYVVPFLQQFYLVFFASSIILRRAV